MKLAIWKVAPFGDYRFHGGQNKQLAFGTEILGFSPLEKDFMMSLGRRNGLRIEDVIRFVKSDSDRIPLRSSETEDTESNGKTRRS